MATIGVLVATATATADPKPLPVDIKAIRDQLLVFQDVKGGTYVVLHGPDSRVFYGTGTTLYEQIEPRWSANGDAWRIYAWSPRLPEMHSASVARLDDGTFKRECDGLDDMVLTQLTGDKAAKVLAKDAFVTAGAVHWAHLLARDDMGIYYYVDRLTKTHGGKGFRVFVGKKGAMQQVPLDEVASDSGGDVFSTKRGELRLVTSEGKQTASWIKGEKATQLVMLDLDVNSALIYRDLGIYTFLGTLCENI